MLIMEPGVCACMRSQVRSPHVQAIQAKSPIAASIERDAIIHSQLHHPNIIGFKRVSQLLQM